MRLVCPNCDAEYEVDDAAIPKGGRDVQCSNCGHAWYQLHPEVEAADEAEADLYEAPVAAVAAPVEPNPVAQPELEREPLAANLPEPEEESPEDDGPAPMPAAPQRSLDETVLAVLREEAERETSQRKAEAAGRPVIETQTEMPLASDGDSVAAAVKRIARMRGETEPEAPPAPKSRREMLPAIEEINSTLRATRERSSDDENVIAETMTEADEPAPGAFRRGFLILVLLAVLIVALYVLAPLIAAKVPALAGVAADYVSMVDAARIWINGQLQALIGALQGLAGGSGG